MEEKGGEGGEAWWMIHLLVLMKMQQIFFHTLILRKEISLIFPACFGRETDEMREENWGNKGNKSEEECKSSHWLEE